jgi:hypothetical protein
LRRSTFGDQKIALTTEQSVAEYFACNAVFGDKRNHSGEGSSPVVLVVDGEGCALNYNLVPFTDPYWGDGKCDWENEIECWDDIELLDEVLLAAEPIPPERYQAYIERGHTAFAPTSPPTAEFQLAVMADTIGKLVEDEITPVDADLVVSALAALRSAMKPSGDRSTSSQT